ncbi:MAG TPA: VOC family protein [Thermoanaerobaculia bacterium]|jgi:catechol 2,3-dioxygenase-like lactoylglutathione lyase family enzyme|nr:VOC family protein [Thermoanaerobaculia bacterium]
MLKPKTIHHASIPVTDLERSRRFYETLFALQEIKRPDFDLPGIWYRIGDKEIHLVAHSNTTTPTLRQDKGVDIYDVHFALRVESFSESLKFLRSLGFHPEAEDSLLRTVENLKSKAGYPQLYLLDPDRNMIEINSERLDAE